MEGSRLLMGRAMLAIRTVAVAYPTRSAVHWVLVGLLALSVSTVVAADDRTGSKTTVSVDYPGKIKPILTRHCIFCHGASKARGDLRLDTAAAALKGAKTGPVIVPGKGEESPLILSLRAEDPSERMPLNRPALSEAEIALLQAWIDQGAAGTAGERPGVPPSATHWAFLPPKRPKVPKVRSNDWAHNPIDRFIQERLERVELSPSQVADPATLLRRVSLDVIGLPPSPVEVDDFLSDPSVEAYRRVVDRLLASPHFGERWARPWLDQARYADSNGYNIDAPRSIWKYRDWIIAAFNADMPFDAFAMDQIAGDLRPGATFAQRIATGFHRNTQINQEGGIDVEQFRIESIVDRVNTTGSVFLGLTIGCAQCHDHKYDPISQREYYKLFAFFNNVDEPELELATPSELARRTEIRAQVEQFHRDLAARYPDLDQRERRWEGTLTLEFTQAQTADVRLVFDTPREKRTQAQRNAMVELMLAREPALRDELARLTRLRNAEPRFVTTMVVSERSSSPRESFVHLGGDFTRRGERVDPGVPAVLPPLTAESSGTRADRMDLARWLVGRRNPLAARVAVNRIWQAYFGRGLVETDDDFGTQGILPSHPELLDWLACELMDRDWSLKSIHRLIVESATYRQSSRVRDEGKSIDPDNRLLWRQTRLRLDAELIRDSALASSGLLSRAIGGPSVFPPQPEGVMNLGQMRRPWQADTGPNRYRRGLYTFFWRATPHPFLTTFDAPGGIQACTRRLRSDTPIQALTLLNDPAFFEIAGGLAARILEDCTPTATDRERLRHGFWLCLARPPTDHELKTLEGVLLQERDDVKTRGTRTAAAIPPEWETIARVLLNLDEFLTRE